MNEREKNRCAKQILNVELPILFDYDLYLFAIWSHIFKKKCPDQF